MDERESREQAVSVGQLRQIRRQKLADLQNAGRDPFLVTKANVTHHSAEIRDGFDALEGTRVSVAGRMMFKRVMGKASFCNLRDLQGDIQIYVARDLVGELPYADFKKFDIGDILSVSGEVFRTKTGEISVRADEVILISKSLQPLPEKYHGLTNVDLRYRQRYLDLVMIRSISRWQIPFYLPGLMMSRDLKFKITRHIKVSEVIIEGTDLRINIDGDIVSMSRADFRINPGSLLLIR